MTSLPNEVVNNFSNEQVQNNDKIELGNGKKDSYYDNGKSTSNKGGKNKKNYNNNYDNYDDGYYK